MKFASMILAASGATALRNVMYFDQYHTAKLPTKDVTGGITHVIMAFANSSLFVSEPAGIYTPFMPTSEVRNLFDPSTKLCIAIGGWGDLDGFAKGSATDAARKRYAKNLAAMVSTHGFDCLDIDWEYPGGNGADYMQIPNSAKVAEITNFPLFLAEIKAALGSKELSIAVPGTTRDMIAFTPEQGPKIWKSVDFVNIMTYDLVNRRDTATGHHTSLTGSLASVEAYINIGLDPAKINLGIAFYAKFFKTKDGVDCSSQPVGCPIVAAELVDGTDAGTSGAMTFEESNLVKPPTDLIVSPNGLCGAKVKAKCPAGSCCSQYGFCGSTAEFCGAGCDDGYGQCNGPSAVTSFRKAIANGGKLDSSAVAQWWWDADAKLFWTWDTPTIIARKIKDIVKVKSLGGIMAWSLAEDSHDWSHLKAMANGLKQIGQ